LATKRIGIIGELQFQLEVEIEEAKEALELFILGLPVTEQQVANIQAKIQCKLTILDLYKQDVEKIKTHTKEKYRKLELRHLPPLRQQPSATALPKFFYHFRQLHHFLNDP